VFPFINLSGKINSSLRRRAKPASANPGFKTGLFIKKPFKLPPTFSRNGDQKSLSIAQEKWT
jgi:hypothetical protein